MASVVGLGLAFFGAAQWTWQLSTEPLVAAGREPYAAWRAASGAAPYRDFPYASGPLPLLGTALAFRAFGTGLATWLAANAVLIAASGALLYRSVFEIAGRLSAFVATLGFLGLFAFAHTEPVSGFAWLAPRSQAATLSVLLALLTLSALRRHREAPGPATAAGVGAWVGLAFLTAPQAILACSAAAVGGIGALAWATRRPAPAQLLQALAALASAAAVLAVAGLAMAVASDVETAEQALGQALRPLLEPALLTGPAASEMVRGMGLEEPGHFLLILAVASALWLALLLPAGVLSLRLQDTRRAGLAGGLAAFAVAAGVGFASSRDWPAADWIAWGSPLLVVSLAALWVSARGLRSARVDEDEVAAARAARVLALALASLGLLSTTGLRARLFDHGHSAGVLAFALAVIAVIAWLPGRLERRGHTGWLVRGTALGLLAVLATAHLRITAEHLAPRTHVLGTGRDALRVRPELGTVLEEALDRIAVEVPEDARLLVAPEGDLVGYLARRRAPAVPPLDPPTLVRMGEAAILEQLMLDPPEFVLVVQRETRELGATAFGRDYAPVLGGWIEQHFEPVARFGAAPFAGAAFGAELRRRGPSLEPPPGAAGDEAADGPGQHGSAHVE